MQVEDLRVQLNLTQKQFAQKLGLSLRTYQGRLMEETNWTFEELLKISELCSGEIAVQFGGDTYLVDIKKGS